MPGQARPSKALVDGLEKATGARAYPVHPVSSRAAPKGAVPHHDLSSPTAGAHTPAPASTVAFPPQAASRAAFASTAALSVFVLHCPQNYPRATPSPAHDSDVQALTFHLLGPLFVSASTDHMIHFWAHEHAGDAAFIFPLAVPTQPLQVPKVARLSFPALGARRRGMVGAPLVS